MTNKRNYVLIFGAMLITILLMVTGCKSASQATTKSTTATNIAEKPIELRFTTVVTSLHPNFKNYEIFANEVNKKTNGKVKITVYPSGTLNPPMETFNAVKNGLADMGQAPVGYSAAVMPLNKLFGDAMMGVPTAAGAAKVWSTAYKNLPELQKELDGVHVLWLTSTAPLSIGTTKKAINKIEDFNGLVMRFPPGLEPLAKAWGVSPINLPVGDIYVALEKKSVSGFYGGSEMLEAMRLAEFTKYVTNASMVYGLSYAIVNQKVWDSFPEDVQKVFNDLAEFGQAKMVEGTDEGEKKALKFAESQGSALNKIEDAELKRIFSASKPVFDKIASDLEAKGKPAKKVLTELERLTSQK